MKDWIISDSHPLRTPLKPFNLKSRTVKAPPFHMDAIGVQEHTLISESVSHLLFDYKVLNKIELHLDRESIVVFMSLHAGITETGRVGL